jgi:hypothetical protein
MNYIKQLQEENAALKAAIQDTNEKIDLFLSLLASPKFSGKESNGDRKDWIATGDVYRIIIDMKK